MRRFLRAGIIGVGGISDDHYRAYRAAGTPVTAIADINPGQLELRMSHWGVDRGYVDYRELLALDDVDVVSVCTPNAWHHPITVAAARAGKHVLCEKPISLSIDQAEEMVRVCREKGVVLQINHRLRASKAASTAKEMIEADRIGKVTFIRLRQAHDWAGATSVEDSFGKMSQSGGGTLLDNGVHMMDLLRFFGGEVADVHARTATLKFDVEVEDTAVASVRFASGALGSVETAWTATGWEEGFWIYGTRGSLECTNRHGRNVDPVLYHSYRTPEDDEWNCSNVDEYLVGDENNHFGSVAAFLDAVRGRGPVMCSGEDGLEAVRLVLAAYGSA